MCECECQCLFVLSMSALRWTGALFRVYPAFHSILARMDSLPPPCSWACRISSDRRWIDEYTRCLLWNQQFGWQNPHYLHRCNEKWERNDNRWLLEVKCKRKVSSCKVWRGKLGCELTHLKTSIWKQEGGHGSSQWQSSPQHHFHTVILLQAAWSYWISDESGEISQPPHPPHPPTTSLRYISSQK